MHVILTGATGLIGTSLLHHILSLPPTTAAAQKLTTLTILSRRPTIPLLEHPDRPTLNTHTKIQVHPHNDFKSYTDAALLSKLRFDPKDNDNDSDKRIAVLWALGVSQSLTKSEAEYDEITRVYALEAAKAFCQLGANQVNFVYVSGDGATWTPGLFTMTFGRVKGRTERELIELMATPGCEALKVYSVRPGGVDAGAEEGQGLVWDLTHRKDGGTGGKTRLGLGFKVMEKVLLPPMRRGVYKTMHSPTGELSRVIVGLAVGDGGPVTVEGCEAEGRVISNPALRRLGGSM